jgi:hypothetical protein
MKKFFKRYFWTILIVLAALGLAGSAAYFSISGLSKLFAGSAMQVIVMASFIEFGKLVTTAALHRYWKKTVWWMKYTLTAMVLAVMLITSMGIYGFLSDAYATTSIELEKIEGKIELIEKQQEQKKVQISGIEEIKTSKSERINSLIDLRVQQEARIDSLYAKGWYNSAKKTQQLIDQSTEEIQSLQVELDSSLARINRVNQEIGDLDIEILDLQNSDVATEIGPLKYMSTVLNRPMESIINYFILMLIFVFDPLAVLLVIFASNVYNAANEDEDEEGLPKKKRPIARFRERLKKKKPETEYQGEVTNPMPPPSGGLHYIDFKHEAPEETEETEEEAVEESNDEQKIVDAINSVEPDDEMLEFSHDFPEDVEEKVIEYVEDKEGGFEKSDEQRKSLASIIQGIESNPMYLSLLDILFIDGNRNVGDTIPPHAVLVQDIEARGLVYEKRVVDNFLTICNLFKITDMSDKDNVSIIKPYEQAKEIISLVSK